MVIYSLLLIVLMITRPQGLRETPPRLRTGAHDFVEGETAKPGSQNQPPP